METEGGRDCYVAGAQGVTDSGLARLKLRRLGLLTQSICDYKFITLSFRTCKAIFSIHLYKWLIEGCLFTSYNLMINRPTNGSITIVGLLLT